MDIARPDLARRKQMRHSLYSVSALIVVALVTVGVSRLEPAAPRVDRDTVYLDTVQRGLMVRQVRGTGTLVPERIRWIPATTDGTVERIVIRPGALVAPDTVILELSNPELEQSTLEARLNLAAAEARYSNRQVEVERDLLDQRATLATTEAQRKTARLQADADGQLFTQGLVSSLQLQQSQSAEQEFDTRYALERERLRMATDTVEAQLAVEQAEVDRLRTLYELRQRQMADLHVRAGMPGVLQQVPLDEGQRITTGTNLARVGDPTVLKAELRIAETQARDVQIGQVGHHRHPQRRHSGARHAHRPGGGERDGDGGRGVGRGPAARRPPGPDGGRHPRVGADGRHRLRRPAGVRAGGERGQPVQGGGGRYARITRARASGPGLGQHDRGDRGSAAGRPGGSVRHVDLGSVRPGAHRIGPLCRVGQKGRGHL